MVGCEIVCKSYLFGNWLCHFLLDVGFIGELGKSTAQHTYGLVLIFLAMAGSSSPKKSVSDMDSIQCEIRKKLNEEKIKLWQLPYTSEDGSKGEEPVALAELYSTELNLPQNIVMAVLETLRLRALEKLAAKRRFQDSGLAVLNVKLTGVVPSQITERCFMVETELSIPGRRLKELLENKCGLEISRLKLIAGGHVIEDDKDLADQNLTHSSQVMVLCLSETEAEARLHEQRISDVKKTIDAAQLLAQKGVENDDFNRDMRVQIADQNGKPLQLPPEESRSLTLAMTLNEKGRVALKKKNYGTSLLLLLEADKEFKKCRADILNAVDNYAILCLDIVWCYLCLQNIEELPDAENRLIACEQCFQRSYGKNLERLMAVKGGTGAELALFVRLHLMQGILAFHKSQIQTAKELLLKSEYELQLLKVDEDKLVQVMNMGFTAAEARLGLRMCQGVVPNAISHIVERREEKKAIKQKEAAERKKKKLSRAAGKCANGEWVNADHIEMMLSMGFPQTAAGGALRQANNDINRAIEILHEHPELLTIPDTAPDWQNFEVTDDVLQQMTTMGYDPNIARQALQLFGGNLQQAINELLKNGGNLSAALATAVAGTSGTSGSHQPSRSSEDLQKELDETAMMQQLVADLPTDEEDHLDLLLNEEEAFIQQYKALLRSVSRPVPSSSDLQKSP